MDYVFINIFNLLDFFIYLCVMYIYFQYYINFIMCSLIIYDNKNSIYDKKNNIKKDRDQLLKQT